ncbi:MAG: TRAP transporter small permease [Deltaproteobacteria bacterium]|nr:TRAP transporter small permease [Deltaproteobacteria bacterium]
MTIWYWLDEKISRVESILVTVMLTLMILVAFSQIVLRNFFATGIDWGDTLVRYLVIWVAFIGASIATKEGKHITIEFISRWVTGVGSTALVAISLFSSAFICGLLTIAAIKFVGIEVQMGSMVFFVIPAWVPALIIPITFGLMTLRFAFRLVNEIARIVGGRTRIK